MPTKPPTDVQLFSKTVIWSVPSLSFCQMILHQSEESFQQRFIFCSSEKLCYLYLLLFACAIGTFPKGQLREGWNPPLGAASVVQPSPVLCPCHSTQMRHCSHLPSEAVEGRSHQEYLQPANLLPLKCWGTLSNYNCGEIFILSLTKMKHLFQKLQWHCASTREPKSSAWSQELLISFISGRSLMRSDREWENIPSLLKYKLSRFQFCCSTTQTGDQPGKTEEEPTQPNACIQCSCVLMADWKDSVTSGGSLGNCSWISIIGRELPEK